LLSISGNVNARGKKLGELCNIKVGGGGQP